jgi:hypothetical protein
VPPGPPRVRASRNPRTTALCRALPSSFSENSNSTGLKLAGSHSNNSFPTPSAIFPPVSSFPIPSATFSPVCDVCIRRVCSWSRGENGGDEGGR